MTEKKCENAETEADTTLLDFWGKKEELEEKDSTL